MVGYVVISRWRVGAAKVLYRRKVVNTLTTERTS